MKTRSSKPYRFFCGRLLAATGLGLTLHGQSVIQFAGGTFLTVTEATNRVQIAVQRLSDLETIVSVDYASTNLTATPGVDYLDVAGTLTFAAGETNQTITVGLINDGLIESAEKFKLTLSNPSAGAVLGPKAALTVQIADNDKGVQPESAAIQVAEDETAVTIGVTRNDDGASPVAVDFATVDGTALAGQDYVATQGTLTFQAGERLKSVTVTILNDGLKEANETFWLTLTNATGGGILGTQASGKITIMDNDPGVSLERSKYGLSEQDAALTVRVLRGNDRELGPFNVELSTADLTATGGVDFVTIHTNLAFAQGETVKTVAVQPVADDMEEPLEQFQLVLDNPSGIAVLGATNATVYLFDATGFTAHRFDALSVRPGGVVELTLGGSVPQLFTNDFDFYPIEVSTNLVDWKPWVTVQRTNAATNAVTCQDRDAGSAAMRFYRTPTNHFITPFPQPPGPFPVGVVSRLVTDPTRRDRFPKLLREACFMVSVWYPAVAEAGKPFARLEDEELTYAGTGRRNLFRSSAQPDVPCAESETPYPILAYSPGGWGFRTELAERGPYLASYGYVVVAADPIDVPTTVLPDGTVLSGNGGAVLTASGFQDRVQDIRVVLDELARWNLGDPLFKGRLDVTNAAVAGWSWGGGVAAEACRVDDRCRAALSFEGYYQTAEVVKSTGLAKPLLGLYAGVLYDEGAALAFHNKATHDSIWFQIRSTAHESFGDYYWKDYPNGGREAASIMNVYTLWFLDKYLKGRDDPIPDPKDYPRVFNFKLK